MLARSARPSSDPDRSLDEATSCSQSQIGQDCDLRRKRTVQVGEALTLSVVVRWEPVRTAVNGTLVARPHEDLARRGTVDPILPVG